MPTAIEKKVKRATSTTFGVVPNPNQITTSGASAMIGSVCDATISGYTARRTRGDQSIAIASATATTMATRIPSTASRVVVSIAGQRLERSSQVERATRPGDGSTRALTSSARVAMSQTRTSATRTSAGATRPTARSAGTPPARPPVGYRSTPDPLLPSH